MEGRSRDREIGRQTQYYDSTRFDDSDRYGVRNRVGLRTMSHSYYFDGRGDNLKDTGSTRGESSSLDQLQWQNLSRPELASPNPYTTRAEMGHGKNDFWELGSGRTRLYGYSNGLSMAPLGKLELGIQKNDGFINFDNSSYGQGQRYTLFEDEGIRGVYDNGGSIPLSGLKKSKEMIIGDDLQSSGRYVKEGSLRYYNDSELIKLGEISDYKRFDMLKDGNGEVGTSVPNVGESIGPHSCLRPSIMHNFDVANNPFDQSSRQGTIFSNDDGEGGFFRRDDRVDEVLGSKRRVVNYYEGLNLKRLAMSERDSVLHQRIEMDDQHERMLRRKDDQKRSLYRWNSDCNGSYRCHGYGGFSNRTRGRKLKLTRRDVKKRLGPIQNAPISISVCGRLEPNKNKFLRRKTDDNNCSSDKGNTSKTVLSEDSDEFNRLVGKAFFKFIKNLHEHPAQRRKYLEQEGEFALKCGVCGSFKEFLGPLELAKHTFMSCRKELRAEHLGFHKALCVLLGWNSATAPNTPWVRQILPHAEAMALKEDFIIWPPVVIIQNISIANRNLAERVIVSIQKFEAILRGMGFNGEKTKVFRGMAANESILVVTFNGTLSGLQEAERLHKHYAENKHGRLELQQNNSTGHINTHQDIRKLAVSDKLESVLYGYLGIVEDLDKLDFNIKSHCVVRSKKEIQDFSDATL
ncbi:uncharacterized protein LOC133792623 [Humulus lupulus]|uniref:uncharacterized protein LOC133792623 n=1 Tax=Humulus lupulus TaxID=3486 RepID=UPI002B415B99|nr:uncharacterized protein LOC133792623 [Humulus lupulus]